MNRSLALASFLRLLAVLVVTCMAVAPPAHAKKRGGKGHGNKSTSVKITRGDYGPPADDRGRGTGGIPAVLHKLDELQKQLDDNAEQIEALQTQVSTLDANVTPCTLQRFRDGLCGADNHPLDLLVSVCGKVGAQAGVQLKYAFTSNLDVQGGIGWKDAPDVHIVENAQLPAVALAGIPPLAVPVILPSELAAQGTAGVGLGLDGCIAPIRIPVGKQLAEPVALAILEKLEAQAPPIALALLAELGGGEGAPASVAGAGAGAGMSLEALGNALAAGEALRDQLIQDDDPMGAFTRGPIGDLAGALPIGNTLSSILADPSAMALPGLQGDSGAGPAALLDGVAGNVCAGPLGGPLAPLCSFIDARVPGIDRVLDLIPVFETIPNLVNDAVDGVRELLGPLFADVNETPQNTLDRFCNSSVGRRKIFDLLCGR